MLEEYLLSLVNTQDPSSDQLNQRNFFFFFKRSIDDKNPVQEKKRKEKKRKEKKRKEKTNKSALSEVSIGEVFLKCS